MVGSPYQLVSRISSIDSIIICYHCHLLTASVVPSANHGRIRVIFIPRHPNTPEVDLGMFLGSSRTSAGGPGCLGYSPYIVWDTEDMVIGMCCGCLFCVSFCSPLCFSDAEIMLLLPWIGRPPHHRRHHHHHHHQLYLSFLLSSPSSFERRWPSKGFFLGLSEQENNTWSSFFARD